MGEYHITMLFEILSEIAYFNLIRTFAQISGSIHAMVALGERQNAKRNHLLLVFCHTKVMMVMSIKSSTILLLASQVED